jgi:nicotinate-nucleotide adenylyltransferase
MVKKKKRIGILGGTFNPIHIAHLIIAQMALETLKLDKVIFVPSYLPPHKKIKRLISAKHRYAMVRLAIVGNSHFSLSDFEIKKKGRSYTIDTIRYLRSRYPAGTRFFFIIGKDMLPGLQTWRAIGELVKLVSFVAVNRPGRISKRTTIKHHLINAPGIDISSSYVRNRALKKESLKYFVPDRVLEYIQQYKVFTK